MKNKHNSCPAIRVAMMPRDTNGMGDIFGGVIMSHVDLAGASAARSVCDNRIVTRVCTVEFHKPVLVNDFLTLWGRVEKIGTTSITVKVAVESERNGEYTPVGEATLVFVAVDENRKPTTVKLRKGVRRPRAAAEGKVVCRTKCGGKCAAKKPAAKRASRKREPNPGH